MPRFALLIIAAFALLFGATAAQAAPAGQTAPKAPVASVAQDDPFENEVYDEDECLLDEDDACLEEDWSDEDLACEDELWDDEGWTEEDDEPISDEETYVDDAEAAAAADDECEDALEGEEVVAPELTALSATVAGEDARLTVQLSFRLDEPGKVELTLARVGGTASKRAKAACPRGVGAKGKKGKKGKKCGGTLPGRMLVTGRAGLNRVALRGRWQGKKLAPGGYRLTATPQAAGASGDTVSFKIAAS